MNEQGLLLFSYGLEVLALFSVVIGIVMLWSHLRDRRAAKLKGIKTPRARLRSVMDEQRRK